MPKLKTGTVLPTEAEDARIREGIAADPDTYEVTNPAEWAEMQPVQRGRPKAEVTKERISVRLSPEVTAYFKATGKGWQTRMDQVLRDYVAQHKSA
jgi:uncharacterized protein (DUF4415 family)